MVREFENYKDMYMSLRLTEGHKRYTKEDLENECKSRLKMAHCIYEDWKEAHEALQKEVEQLDKMCESLREEKNRLLELLDENDGKYSSMDNYVKSLIDEKLVDYVRRDELGEEMDNVDYERCREEARAWT